MTRAIAVHGRARAVARTSSTGRSSSPGTRAFYRGMILVTAIASFAPVSYAQETTTAPATDEEARARFEAGRAAFAGSRYAEALADFERAYSLSGRALLLFNIGLCHDRLGHDREALAAFEQYLAREPGAENRAEVEQRIRVARARVTAETEPPSIAPWIVVGSGGVVAIAGAVLLAIGRVEVGAVESIAPGTRNWSEVEGRASRAEALSITGLVAIAVGVAAAAGGLVWALSASESDGAIAWSPSGVGARW
jgi:tetratricopeptide (TPR) repeat protein